MGGRSPAETVVLVTGATGFIGRALVPALRARGYRVVAASRHPPAPAALAGGVEWRACDLLRPETLPAALAGVHVAYYLVHSMGGDGQPFAERERHAALAFAAASSAAGVERIIYLGGPAPRGRPSAHLASRLAVGEILRGGPVPALELRASMVVGPGSASWTIVRDLAMRLPAMVLPRWLKSRTRPVALDDAIAALAAGIDVPLDHGAWFDIPGPDTLSGREILEHVAALRGRRIAAVEVPLLTPRLSALWLRLVTGADFSLARTLAVGLADDLLPAAGDEDRYWTLIGHTDLVPFDQAAILALASEVRRPGLRPRLARLEEALVDLGGPRKQRDSA